MYFEQSSWNNVRIQKQQERDKYDKEMERRKNEIGSTQETVENYLQQKMELVGKMRLMFDRIMPNLSDNEYIIIIDRYGLVNKSYPFEKSVVEEIVRYLQTFKKYVNASMVDTKKLTEDSYDYQSILQRDNPIPSTKPEMLIPPVQSANAFVSIQSTPIVQIQSSPIVPQQTHTVPIQVPIQSTVIQQTQPSLIQTTTQLPVQQTQSVPIQVPIQSTVIQQTQPVPIQVPIQMEETPGQKPDSSGSPTFHIINYIDTRTISVDVSKPHYFTSVVCTSSFAERHGFHTSPYILMVVNSKYKIPLYPRKKETGYYEFHKKKGPFYATRIDIQLFDHLNEPIVIKQKPTEIFHILFETLID
jgi:hypothetical protein